MTTRRKPTRAKQLGVTDAEYARLLEAQGGGCAICGNTPKTRRLDVDHDHKTGKVRGLLCHRCNRALPTWVTVGWLYYAMRYLTRCERLNRVGDSPEVERLTRWLELIATARPMNEDTAAYLQRKARMALDGFEFK